MVASTPHSRVGGPRASDQPSTPSGRRWRPAGVCEINLPDACGQLLRVGQRGRRKPTDSDFLAELLMLLDDAGGEAISQTYHAVMQRAESTRLHRGRRRVDPAEITLCGDDLGDDPQ